MVIVYLGHVPLEAHHHLRLFQAYAQRSRVVYVEMGRRGDRPDEPAFTTSPGLERRRVAPLIPASRLPAITRWNWWLAAHGLLANLRRQGAADLVLVTQKPDMLPTLQGLDADITLYQIVDDYVGLADRGRRAGVAAGHRRMIRQARCVWAISPVQVEEARRHRPDVHLVPQGVDHGAFAAAAVAPPPPALASIAAPRVGSVGNLNDRIDWALVEGIARARPGWSLVFVGPIYQAGPRTTDALARLRGLPNVHLLPEIRPEDLPGAIAGLDVGLILYAPGPGTLAINPLKLYQFLAAGRPVVSTPIPAVEELRDIVAIASSVDEFVAAIEAALAAPDANARAAERRRWALAFDWEQVAAVRLELLNDAPGRRDRRPPAPPGGESHLPIR